MKKIKSIILQNEIDPKTGLVLIKDYNSYNSIKFYLQKDEEKPNIKYVIYMFDENSKIEKETKGKTMKQSEFQQYVIEQFKEQKKFNEQQLKFNEQQMEFNKSFSNRLNSIENRLTRLESFHEKDIDDYESKKIITFYKRSYDQWYMRLECNITIKYVNVAFS